MPQRSPLRDMGISIAFCFVFQDLILMNHMRGSHKNTGVYKNCTRVVISTIWWRIITSSIQKKQRKSV
jgi:hypothetical protein